MDSKKIKLLTLSVFTLLFGSIVAHPQAQAVQLNDPVLVPTIVISDEWVEETKAVKCGKAEDTSLACQDALRTCQGGVDKIMDNADEVCNHRPQDCTVDVVVRTYTQNAYDLLVGEPLKVYSNSFEVAGINNCRSQHPKSEDSVVKPSNVSAEQKAEEERKKKEELGELDPAPAGNQANAAPVAPAAAPAVVSNEGAAPATVDANPKNDAGGCSLQAPSSAHNVAQGWFAAILMFVPFAAVSSRRVRALKK